MVVINDFTCPFFEVFVDVSYAFGLLDWESDLSTFMIPECSDRG